MASFTIKFGNLDKTSNGNVYSDINVTNLSDKKITDKNAIKQSIYNMLHWRMGERVLFPDFGNPLYSYLFETINSSTIEQIKLAIRKMFTYEPRVKIDNIDIKNIVFMFFFINKIPKNNKYTLCVLVIFS